MQPLSAPVWEGDIREICPVINSCYFIDKREREKRKKREILARKDCRCLYTVLYRAFMVTANAVVEHYILAILCCRCHTDRIYYAVGAIQTEYIMLCCTYRIYYAVPYKQNILSCATHTGYIKLCHTYRIYYAIHTGYIMPYIQDILCHTYRIYYAVPYIQNILCCASITDWVSHSGKFLKDYKSFTQYVALRDIFKRLRKLHTVCCAWGYF